MNPVCEFCGNDIPPGIEPYVIEDAIDGQSVHWVCGNCLDEIHQPLPA